MSLDSIKTYTGVVKEQRINQGTGSDHVAVVLETSEGTMKLRLTGGNPFRDAELDKLIGKKISVRARKFTGRDELVILQMGDVTILNPSAAPSRKPAPKP